MQATTITAKYGADAAFTMALQAGVDLLVYANQQVYDDGIVDKILDIAIDRVRNGDLTRAQVDAAATRVDALRR
jgi:beta-N-acetylhexosaminidase